MVLFWQGLFPNILEVDLNSSLCQILEMPRERFSGLFRHRDAQCPNNTQQEDVETIRIYLFIEILKLGLKEVVIKEGL